jgi:molecular chaperone GrpE
MTASPSSKKLEEAQAKALYAAAETQNVRRRRGRRSSRRSAYANTGFARDMLA